MKIMKMTKTLTIISIAVALVIISFLLQSHIGLGLADEGYLWYGTWRSAMGDIPLRDFRSYQPGRYYWTAAWSFLFGQGILGVRASIAIFQVIGLTCGLLTIRRLTRSWITLCLIGLLLLIWMYPYHKVFEHSLTMMFVYGGTLLIEKPSLHRHFLIGILVGIMACFGEHHGFFGSVSSLGLILMIWYKIDRHDLFKRLVVWSVGIGVGYLPMLLMFIGIPGVWESFVQRVEFIFTREGFNLPLPVPWPWLVDFTQGNGSDIATAVSTGLFFLLLPVFCVLVGMYLIWAKRPLQTVAPLIACFFAEVTYLQYAFSRADLGHLAFAIHPLLIGLLALPMLYQPSISKKIFNSLLVVLCSLSLLTVGKVHPVYRKLIQPQENFVLFNLRGENLWIDTYTAKLIQTVIQINTELVSPEESFVIAPHWPAFYPILQRKSPWWDTYLAWRISEPEARKMISDLQTHRVNWILLGDVALDGRDDLRFRNTHRLVWEYIIENFQLVPISGLPGNFQLLRRRN